MATIVAVALLSAAAPGRVRAAADSDAGSGSASKTSKASEASGGSSSSSAGSAKTADQASADKKAHTVPEGNADMAQLLRLWGVFGAPPHTDCRHLHVGDLRCLSDQGTLAKLVRYDRPALLELRRDGKRQTVLLSDVSADGKTWTLVGSQATHKVDRARLQALWTGRFDVVWRADSGAPLIAPGGIGPSVVWLRKRLRRIEGQKPTRADDRLSPIFDTRLEKRLKAFQRKHGLRVDGLAGPRTQMVLNRAVDSPGAPSLHPKKSQES